MHTAGRYRITYPDGHVLILEDGGRSTRFVQVLQRAVIEGRIRSWALIA